MLIVSMLKGFYSKFAPALILMLVWLYSCQHPFFWDTIQLASRQAQWYYDQHFQYLLLPDEIDSGHPSGFGWYLALSWQLFGQSLLVSHLMMLPFLIFLLMGLFRLSKIFHSYFRIFFPLLLVLDPVFLGQSSLVSPDIALITLFLWGLIGVLEKRRALVLLCCLGLAMLSLRGMMAVFCLYLFQMLGVERGKKAKPICWIKNTFWYLPAACFALAFLGYHAWAKNWVGFHQDSPWRESFNIVGLKGLARNGAVLVWRVLDFGRLFLVFATAYLFFRQKRPWHQSPFFILLLLTLMIQMPHFLLFQGVSAHRYLMPFYLALGIFFFQLLDQSQLSNTFKGLLLAVVLLGLASGNFWVYPDGVAQGWDATPAHWPHFSMRKKVMAYLDENHIPLDSVGTTFPEIGPVHWRELNGRQSGFSPLNLEKNEYVYYSSVMNDFSDEQRKVLFKSWTRVLTLKKGRLCSILFKKPE